MSFGPEKPAMDINEALAIIEGKFGEIAQLGANDVEPSIFDGIRKRLLAGELSPEDAVREANDVLHSKMDYH